MTRTIAIITVFAALLIAAPSASAALSIAVQDQGASTADLDRVAGGLGARTERIIVTPGSAKVALVQRARAAGRTVQVAIQAKSATTAGDVRWLLRQWRGQVATVSIGNEPELNGMKACTYARLYRRAYAMIRREFPKVRVGFGEFSPYDAVKTSDAIMACKGPRLRADFWAWHAYQFDADPLAPYRKSIGDWLGTWWGIGDAGRIKSHLSTRSTRARLSTRTGRALPIRITEFSYLVTGRMRISPVQAAAWWPRAVKQARKHAEQLVVYGTGPVHDGSNWGSAALLDSYGRVTPALRALAEALGRSFPVDVEPVHEARQSLLPSGDETRVPPLPTVPVGEGAAHVAEPAVDEPVVEQPVEDPAPVEPAPVVVPDPVPPVVEQPVPPAE